MYACMPGTGHSGFGATVVCKDGVQRAGNARAQVFAAVTRHVDWGIVRCLVIAGPGFTKDQFRRYLDEEAVRRDVRCCPATKRNELKTS